ncbi:MAG: hypothetical protein ACK5HR_01840 [Mycoplasmatales bacterium]
MRKLIGFLLSVVLIIVITITLYFIILLFQQRLKYNELYDKEIYGELHTFNGAYYEDIMADVDAIPGVTITNTLFSGEYEYDNLRVYTDEVYYNKVKDNLNFVAGQGFTSDDFVTIYKDDTFLPLIITDDYAQTNHIQVGDEVEFEDQLPSICQVHTAWESGMQYDDEQSVTIKYPEPDEICDDMGGLTNIRAKVKGIINNNNIDIIDQKQVKDPFILPTFIVDDENMHLYDLDSYFNHQPIYTNILWGQRLFIDYKKISPSEFKQRFEAIKEKYSTDLMIFSETLTYGIDFEDELQRKMKKGIIFVYTCIILVILYFSYLLNELKYKEYKFVIYHLLGAKWKNIHKTEIIKELPYIIGQIILLAMILYEVNNLTITKIMISVFVSLNLIKYILTLIRYKSMYNKQLDAKYIEGELWLN